MPDLRGFNNPVAVCIGWAAMQPRFAPTGPRCGASVLTGLKGGAGFRAPSPLFTALNVLSPCNPVALGAIRWKYYIVYCVWLVFELAFMWRYAIETKGRSLEETAAIFDGDAVLSDLTKRTKEDVAHAGVGFDESSKSSSTEKISNPDGRTKM